MPSSERISDVKFYFRLSDFTLGATSRRLACRTFDPTALPQQAIDVPAIAETEGWLLEGLPAAQENALASSSNPWLVYCKARYNRHVADFSGGFDAYMAKFSSKTRSTLRRKMRKFSEASGGPIKWRCYRKPEDMRQFYELARELSKTTYQERLLKTGLPEGDLFLSNLVGRARHQDVRAYILFLDDVPVSYLLLPIEGHRAIYAFLGYDQKIAELSPGTVLHLLAIEDLCNDDKVRYLDFTQGEGQQKELFGTFSVPCVDLLLLRPSLHNRVLISAYSGWLHLEKRIGETLDRVGLKKSIKSGLRKRFSALRGT